jgi:hypothetical protein
MRDLLAQLREDGEALRAENEQYADRMCAEGSSALHVLSHCSLRMENGSLPRTTVLS